jgi:hypothetical protein
MLLRLLRFGFVAALLSGGLGGALAAGACAHAGGTDATAAGETHACCPHAERDAPHCQEHGELASEVNRHDMSLVSHGGGQRAGGAHAGAGSFNSAHVDETYFNPTHSPRASAQPMSLCAHCLRLPAPQRASAETREPGRARDDASRTTPDAQRQPTFKFVSFVRAVAVSEHGPPTNARRHVILGLFLI